MKDETQDKDNCSQFLLLPGVIIEIKLCSVHKQLFITMTKNNSTQIGLSKIKQLAKSLAKNLERAHMLLAERTDDIVKQHWHDICYIK